MKPLLFLLALGMAGRVSANDDYVNISTEIYSFSNINPSYVLAFFDSKSNEVGRMDFKSGELIFTGKANKSAKVLFNYLKKYVDEYIQNGCKDFSAPQRRKTAL